MKKAIIIYGPPGSGKGTQAELLTKKKNFIHFDTGKYIETLLRSPESNKDAVLKREKKLFDSGILCTPSWVLSIVKEGAKNIEKAGFSVVFSGSPRTMFEAVGDNGKGGLLDVLEKVYGKQNIFVLHLDVSMGVSTKRNTARFICSVCGLPRLASETGKKCAFCAGALRRRTLDDPKVIPTRIKEYKERTYPIMEMMKKRGYKIITINGAPAPFKVHENVLKALKI